MNIVLTPQLEALVRSKVESGSYSDASEVVREALQLLDDYEREEAFRAAVMVGYEEAERGEGIPWTPELREEIRRSVEKEAREGSMSKADVLP